jgi:hypothetical protein
MKEYMLLVRNQGTHHSSQSQEKHETFLKACSDYIGVLKKEGKLLSAQPMVREGTFVSGTPDNWKETPYEQSGEMIVGYYHILAADEKEAIRIAKMNPEFAFSTTARVEVRPIKMKEQTTGFVYPSKS